MNRKFNLGYEIYDSLSKGIFQTALIDFSGSEPIRLSKGILLVLAIELSKELRTKVEQKRVGVVLPPGAGGILANLAIFFAGKVPVNLNFTAGSDSVSNSIKKAGVEEIVTATLMKEKFRDFPWGNHIFDLPGWTQEIKRRKIFLFWKLLLLVLPFEKKERKRLRVLDDEKNSEAALLFTSGSSGYPKGVPLSHENLLSNCEQITKTGLFRKNDRLLVNLPLFHSFGFTVGMIYPLLDKLVMVCSPSPLDLKTSLRAIEQGKVEIVLGTPTFLKGYLGKAKNKQLDSVRYVIAGAEKTPIGLKEKWESTCQCRYLEGYGMTESSPGISFNLPGSRSKEGSVGTLLSNIEAKTIHPDSGSQLPPSSTGVLCFRGPNIFKGYLEDPDANKEAFDEEGWLRTGDLGRLDEDGFLFIEGRLSRFSKIGGEMVPHEKIEELVCEILQLDQAECLKCAVIGAEDENKGERLILFLTELTNLDELRKKISVRGISNLWIPKELKIIEKIPILGSGKLNLAKLNRIAENSKSNNGL